jgi:ECF sigma factor
MIRAGPTLPCHPACGIVKLPTFQTFGRAWRGAQALSQSAGMNEAPQQVTQILEGMEAGDPLAAERLLPLVYAELRRLAAHKMAKEVPGQTLQINDALKKLEAEAPEKALLVKLRFFAGLTVLEAAEALGIAPATAKRYWAFARAWLYSELQATP